MSRRLGPIVPRARLGYMWRCIGGLVFLVLLVSPALAQQYDIELVWVDNSTDEDGFRIERKLGPQGAFEPLAVVGPNVQAYTDTAVNGGETYCYRIKAFNAAGESAYTNEACGSASQTVAASGGGGGGGGGGCFIATAAFGSPWAPEVQVLRTLRDRYLLPHPLGRAAVAVYYRLSPPLAEIIRTSETLRALTRAALWPVVGWAALTMAAPVAGGGLALLPLGLGVWWLGRRRAR